MHVTDTFYYQSKRLFVAKVRFCREIRRFLRPFLDFLNKVVQSTDKMTNVLKWAEKRLFWGVFGHYLRVFRKKSGKTC